MLFFNIPKNLNGLQLAKELNIAETAVTITDDKLRIDIDPSKKSQVESVIANHKPKEATVIDKLAASGISLEELRVALGL